MLDFKPKNNNILIFEDAKLINESLFLSFKESRYNCFYAYTMQEAEKILNSENIHYLLLDLDSDSNSYDLVLKLKYTQTRIFILNNIKDRVLQDKAYEDGVLEFIVKDDNIQDKITHIEKKILKLENNKLQTILILNGSKRVRSELKMTLEKRFYNIIYVENEKEAISIILEKKIDLILIDEETNKLSAKDFLEHNKSEILIKQYIPVIVLTIQTSSYFIRDCLEAGAVDIIQIPFVSVEVVLKINVWTDYKQKTKENKESTKLLNQYKDTVDRSSIVAKTDPFGIITYVNDQFCSITGYSRDELIGASHNIIRNPNTSTNFYKKLWKTIKEEKQPWNNLLNNKNKNGDYYWVKTMINPILDINGNVLEYIAISQDVTNDQKIKDYFKTKFTDSTKNLNEAMNLYDEYKRAMNESSIVSRTDLRGCITFVNDEFCKISGYKKEELMGKNHNIIRHPDMKKEIFKEVWHTIKNGETWQGVIKNKTKSGGIYWVDSTIVPIKDKSGKIIEYMGIRKNLTSLFNLHAEIDHTQKEIIYRMGEIGETRSKETGNHVKRVAEYTKLLGELYGLDDKTVDTLFTASPMHDIGKVGIPDSILKKPGKLTPEEFEIMKSHAEIGFNILKGSEREVLKAAAIVSNEHHEKWNGKGYPRGLKKEEIHIFGRITAIADVFDALGSHRCYKKAWDDEKIFKFLKEERSESFDPLLIDLFFKNVEKFIYIRNKYVD